MCVQGSGSARPAAKAKAERHRTTKKGAPAPDLDDPLEDEEVEAEALEAEETGEDNGAEDGSATGSSQ